MNTTTIKLRDVIYVGLDVHKDSIQLAAVKGYEKTLLAEKRFGTKDLSKLRKFLNKLSKHGFVRCCYEASGAGYALRRTIVDWGFGCEIAASSLIPTKPGERKKCDRLDAKNLAHYFQAELLTLIHVPTQEQEAARDLVRCRRAIRKDVTSWKHRIVKFLATKGVVYHEGTNWTGKHRIWLERVRLPVVLDQENLRYKLDLLALLERRLEELDSRLDSLSKEEPYREPVRFLRAMRGIETYSAMVIVTEIADVRRFSNLRQLMDYTGLTPSVHQSGNSDNQAGSITKAGNPLLRHVLVQAAWNYSKTPGRARDLRNKQKDVPSWVLEHSIKAQQRLHKRFHHLAHTRDRKKAVVATARELAGFVGALLFQIAA